MHKKFNMLFICCGLFIGLGVLLCITITKAIAADTQVNSYTTDDQKYSSVAMDSSGNYVIVWQSEGQDGDLSGIFAQRYDSSGNPVGSEFQVNTYTTGPERYSDVASLGANGFVIVMTKMTVVTNMANPRARNATGTAWTGLLIPTTLIIVWTTTGA